MAFVNALPPDQVPRLTWQRLVDHEAEAACCWAENAVQPDEAGGGNAAAGVIYGAVIGVLLWAGLLLML